MTGNVVNIRDDMAPPTTAFEREAVEVLLSNIRSFRDASRHEPQRVVVVLLGHNPDQTAMSHEVGWFNTDDGGMRLHFAYGAALLQKYATAGIEE